MNKNTLLAFAFIMLAIWFFSSPFYYRNILKRPHPTEEIQREREVERQEPKKEQKKESSEREIEEKEEKVEIADTVIADTIEETVSEREADTIWIETPKIICAMSTKGARILSIRTKEYTYNAVDTAGSDPIEIVANQIAGGANLKINEEEFDTRIFSYAGNKEKIKIRKNQREIVRFVVNDEKLGTVEKLFIFNGESYKIGLQIQSEKLDGKKVSVGWEAGISESEEKIGRSPQSQRRIHIYGGGSPERITRKKPGTEESTGYLKWVGVTSKYFLVALVADTVRDTEISILAFEEKDTAGTNAQNQQEMNYAMWMKRFASGSQDDYWIYAGPTKMEVLKSYEIDLHKVMFGGWRWFLWADRWFPWICEFVLWLLNVFYSILKDYGIAIVMLTVLSRLITYPMTQSSMKSMARMREIQPKMTKIREKYKNDSRKMNEKMMELYKKEGVNPFNPGCLPMFLQMPIFIALFVVLRSAIELRGEGTWIVPWISDLSKPEILIPLPFTLPLYGGHIGLLPIIMGILTFFQQKATMKDPNQKAMVYVFPFMMLLFFNNFPSGVVLYWTFSNALGVLQQFITDKNKAKAASAKA